MKSQPCKQTIATNILSNIARSKSNQTMKFGRLITWVTFLLKNHTQKLVKKLFPDPFLENQNWVRSKV